MKHRRSRPTDETQLRRRPEVLVGCLKRGFFAADHQTIELDHAESIERNGEHTGNQKPGLFVKGDALCPMGHLLIERHDGDFRLQGADLPDLVAQPFEYLNIEALGVDLQEDAPLLQVGHGLIQELVQPAYRNLLFSDLFRFVSEVCAQYVPNFRKKLNWVSCAT